MIGEIDLSARPHNPQLFLCKPNRTIIAKLKEAYNIQSTLKFGNINELSFSILHETMKHQESVPNSHIPLLKERYLVKYVLGDYIEWYMIDKIQDVMEEDKDVRNVHLFSLGIELQDKMIKRYNVVSYNATHLLNDVLQETLWRVGYVDADFDLKYRSINIDSATVLECVYTISSTFQSLVVFDTENRLVNLYKPDAIGSNRGLKIKYGKYLKTLNKEMKVDEIATRLRVEGKDGLSIQRVNPTGVGWIEDFSHFIYPAERDPITKEITKSSDYWSDSLVKAQLDYQDLLQIKKGEFDNLLSQKNSLQSTLTTKQNELDTLNSDMAIILDNIDVAQASNQSTTTLFQQRDSKQAEIDAKQSEIDSVNANISNVDSQIASLRSAVAIENNFTAEQINERNQYIIEKEWSDQNYTDDNQLYEDALKKFDEIKVPQTVIEIDVVNFLRVVESQRDWDRLVLGDIISINYDKINVDVTAKIIEVEFDFENDNIKLTIANVKEIERTYDKWVKMLNQATSTSTTFDMNRSRWDTVDTVNDEVTNLLNNVWQTAERAINGGVNESVTIDRRGITIKDPTDPLKFIRMTHGVIGFTSDGGNSFKLALDPSGVYAEHLVGKIILGNNLTIEDDTGSFKIVGNLLSVTDTNNIVRVMLGEYTSGKYGLLLKDKTGNQTILDEDGMLQTWQQNAEDNVDASNTLMVDIYIPTQTIRIQKALLRFRLKQFRTYSKGAASGGSYASTSGSGGGTTPTSGGGFWFTESGYTSGIEATSTDGSHNHGISSGTVLATSGGGSATFLQSGSHSHVITLNHRHNVTIPDHTHNITIPSHTHPIDYGIYKSTSATGVTVKINGVDRTSTLGGGTGFSSDQSSLDIGQYLTIGQWNTIELGSSQLGRISTTVFLQCFLSTVSS